MVSKTWIQCIGHSIQRNSLVGFVECTRAKEIGLWVVSVREGKGVEPELQQRDCPIVYEIGAVLSHV